jgi:ABC-type sugar transport system ATPase subunit
MSGNAPTEAPPHLRLTSCSVSYGSVQVLKNVSFDVLPGEVHVLAGENGAGKSTLIKVIGGVVTHYTGDLEVAGKTVRWHSPHDAAGRGVSVIHQELSLVPSMTVADNLFLGDLPTKNGFVRTREMRERSRSALEKVGLTVSPDTLVGDLPIATQQLVEVAKALRRSAKVVVMDEPTSALNVQEAERLFQLIAELKSQGCGVVYISHKMDEIERLADRITVLRDGEWIATEPAAQIPPDRLVRLMVGDKDMRAAVAYKPPNRGEPILEAELVSVRSQGRELVSDVSLSVRKGEVLGLAGLEGSGNSALLLGLFGSFGPLPAGSLRIAGKPVRISSPSEAIKHGVALLTSDRKASGLILPLSVAANITLADIRRLSSGGWRRPRMESAVARNLADRLKVRAASLEMPVGELSGGNQQKVALAKWVQTEPQVLLLDEPTRGIDINAKREIYALIEQWKEAGMGIVLITSELPELLLLSDRIMVMHRGRVIRELSRDQADADSVVQAAMNAR